jgi:hypothetical protein
LDDQGRDWGTNFILRIKEQEAHLILQEHDDDDDDGRNDTRLFIGVTEKKSLNFQKWQIGEEVRLKCYCCFFRKHYNVKQLSWTSTKYTDTE